MAEELTEDGTRSTGPEDAGFGDVESAVSAGKGGLPAVRARSLHLEEGPGDAVGAGVAGAVIVAEAAPAKGADQQPVRPVPDGAVRVIIMAGGGGGSLGWE